MARLIAFWSVLGPGILLAATSVGASHLVLAPRAGMLYGPTLLWLILVAHIIKYPAFMLGPRYAIATGENLLSGYARVPGPKRWPLALFALFSVAQGVGVAVAVVGIAASVLVVTFGDGWLGWWTDLGFSPLAFWGVIIATVSYVLLVVGKYPGMDLCNRVMMLVLAVLTVVAFALKPPPAEAYSGLFVPMVPAGSLILIAAILGWMPTGIDVSIWHSMWALEKKGRWAKVGGDQTGRLMKTAMLDLKVGYGLSIFLGVVFYLLGTYLSAEGGGPDKAQVAVAIAEVYRGILGRWAFPLFMLAAFCAMFSTTYIVMDGFPRSLAEALKLFLPSRRRQPGLWSAPYWVLLTIIWLAVIPILIFVPKPMLLVKTAAVLGFMVAPLYYGLNVYCASRFIPEGPFRPSRITLIASWAGAALMAVASVLFLWTMLG